VVVASIDTYLRYAEAMGITAPIARPPAVTPAVELAPAREELIVPPSAESPAEVRSRRRTVE
jgi:hypothetical protein